MTRTRRWTGLMITALAAAPLALSAQAGPGRGPQRGPGARGEVPGAGVEQVMRMRERLGLTEQQVEQLDQLRQELVAERSAHRARMEELRSRVRAGGAEPEQLREAMRAQGEARSALRESHRERVLAVLDQAQRDSLQQIGARAEAFRMGRQSALRGRGRGQRFRPGGGPPGSGGGRPGLERGRRGPAGAPGAFRRRDFRPGPDGFGPPPGARFRRGPFAPGTPPPPGGAGSESDPPEGGS